LHRNGEFEQY
jgi:uncharacterized protein YbjT (DUF2867 family)